MEKANGIVVKITPGSTDRLWHIVSSPFRLPGYYHVRDTLEMEIECKYKSNDNFNIQDITNSVYVLPKRAQDTENSN